MTLSIGGTSGLRSFKRWHIRQSVKAFGGGHAKDFVLVGFDVSLRLLEVGGRKVFARIKVELFIQRAPLPSIDAPA